MLEPAPAQAWVWRRGDDGEWSERVLDDTGDMIDLPALGFAPPLSEVYDGVPGDPLAPGPAER